ncbi:hypothetical protein ALC60_10358 [Trachymyrmex zeteki]|uniref:Uncharacterized protein n=1 Tax=Mycetomoellerius zeteki TaxID=64791 RepID=A0A151WRR9_9HYME|nr:hypothetical protein ALC60_10358 [Trachymyrmex zeteki]
MGGPGAGRVTRHELNAVPQSHVGHGERALGEPPAPGCRCHPPERSSGSTVRSSAQQLPPSPPPLTSLHIGSNNGTICAVISGNNNPAITTNPSDGKAKKAAAMSSPPKHRRGFDPNDPTEFHRYRRVKTKQRVRGQRFRSHGGASAERRGGSWRCSSTGAFHCTFAAVDTTHDLPVRFETGVLRRSSQSCRLNACRRVSLPPIFRLPFSFFRPLVFSVPPATTLETCSLRGPVYSAETRVVPPGAPLGGTHSPFASDRQGYARQSQQRGCRGGPGRN